MVLLGVIFIPFLKNAVSSKMTFTQNYLHPPSIVIHWQIFYQSKK